MTKRDSWGRLLPETRIAKPKPTEPEPARLVQDFSGTYHISYQGKIQRFSLSLREAMKWADQHRVRLV